MHAGRRFSDAFLWSLAVLLALGHALLAVTATAEKCVTADEIAHLAAGHAYNTRGDYRLQPENGNLPQRWAALPLTVAGAPPSPATVESWRRGDVWRYGQQLFYHSGLSTDSMLLAGRAMIALFSAATALLVFAWSRALFGWRGGYVSLVLHVFSPTFLAHGALATSDVVMTFFFLAAVGAWWRQLETPRVGPALLSSVIFGLAWVSKYSAVLLAPMFAGCAIVWLVGHRGVTGWRQPLRWLAGTTLLHVVVAWLVIWSFYGFRFEAFAVPTEAAQFYRGDWAWILDGMGWPRRAIEAAREAHALPEAFLYGFAFVLQFSRERAAFLNGDYSTTGWPMFFPFTFAVKSTLPFLLLLLTAGGARVLRLRAERTPAASLAELRPLTPLLALLAVYGVMSVASHLNIGHRHILPLYPVLFILAGSLGRFVARRRIAVASGVIGLLAWHAGESLWIRPHYLAYFNELVGGPRNGWRHLVDSSLDWGQDLPGLKRWIETHARGERAFLSYFGTGDPAYEGVDATVLAALPDLRPRRWQPLRPGIYAFGATMLQQVYSDVRGPWTMPLESEYQQLRAIEPTLLAYQGDAGKRAELLRSAPAGNWSAAWKRYEQLRLARLCHYLRVRKPEAMIGYSILVYRLDATELQAAAGGTLDDWRRLIERAAADAATTRPGE